MPLIIWDPRMAKTQHGTTNDDIVLNVDLAPTILASVGIKAPKRMQGTDIAPLYLAKNPPVWRTEYFEEHATIKNINFIPASQALVRKDWKYIYWPDFKTEQLFDLTTDPHEEKDLIADPTQKDKLDEMRQRFGKLKAAAR